MSYTYSPYVNKSPVQQLKPSLGGENPGFGETAGLSTYMLPGGAQTSANKAANGTSYPTPTNQALVSSQISTPASATNTGGGGGGGGTTGTAGVTAPDPTAQLINDNYSQIMNYLGGLENTANDQYGQIQSGINQGIDTSLTNLGATNQAGVAQIDESQKGGEQRKQDALIAAQRLYNELTMGGQQRFGGASSAGEAYAALTGRELQRNNQQTNTDFSTFMGQIATARNNLQVQFENGQRSLEQQRNDSLAQAQRDYQDKISQIQQSKTQAATDKNNALLSALQDLRNNVYQINVTSATNSQALASAKATAEKQLTDFQSTLGQTQSNVSAGQTAFNTNTTTNPTTSLAINAGANSPTLTPTGAITPTTKKDQLGQYAFA